MARTRRYRVKSKRLSKGNQKSVIKRGRTRRTVKTVRNRSKYLGNKGTLLSKRKPRINPLKLSLTLDHETEPERTTEEMRTILSIPKKKINPLLRGDINKVKISALAINCGVNNLYKKTDPIVYNGKRTFEVEFNPKDPTNLPTHIKTLFPEKGYEFTPTKFNTHQSRGGYSGCLITKDGKKSLLKIINFNGEPSEGPIKKPIHIHNLFKTFKLQQDLSERGVCPKIKKFTIIEVRGSFIIYIVFEYLDGYMGYNDIVENTDVDITHSIRKLKKNIELINDNGFNHNDLNGGNIMINLKTNDVKIIDFDKAREREGELEYEHVSIFTQQLIKSRIPI